MSTVIGIILEAFIAVAHADAARDVWASVGQDSTGGPSSPLSRTDAQGNSYLSVLVSIQRLKDENVFFALFQVFQLYLGMDAVSDPLFPAPTPPSATDVLNSFIFL